MEREGDRQAQDRLVDEILQHLDREVRQGAARMSVEMDDSQEEYAKVSHKCCKVYGKDATRMVGELDMYSDLYLQEMKQKGEL
ncbi:MAG: hypothetical protein J5898_07350 [Lachnospiraceae bacterium]|nr:hypothetical protein [Lachnospiraceae bacterium]